MARLAEDRRLVEPFRDVIDTEWFKEKLKEGVESGEIKQPRVIEHAPEDAIYELERRKLDPDFENVRAAMRSWSITLPPTMQVQLDSNVVVFNKEYDRIAGILREKRVNKPLTTLEKKKVDKIIEKKEAAKDLARTIDAGVGVEVNPGAAKDKRVRDLKRIMKDGRVGDRDSAAAEYLLLTAFSKDEPRDN